MTWILVSICPTLRNATEWFGDGSQSLLVLLFSLQHRPVLSVGGRLFLIAIDSRRQRTDLETGPAVNLVLVPTQRGPNYNLRFSGKEPELEPDGSVLNGSLDFAFFSFFFLFLFCFCIDSPSDDSASLCRRRCRSSRADCWCSFPFPERFLFFTSSQTILLFSFFFFFVGFFLPGVAAMGGEHVKQSRGENLILTSAFCGRSDPSLINNRLE